ncbi:MAG: [protein-PII] uridylyltransferase [Legionella sp.]|nr:[protein-PII] uridylyltransferase [Legionella sp.]
MKNANLQIKQDIKHFKHELCVEFCQLANVVPITKKLCAYLDKILIQLFSKNKLDKNNQFCLLALGSYGRRELQLHSDIDLLLLHTPIVTPEQLQQAQCFIQDCWDIGLNIGHQTTTVSDCADLASNDLSVISNIMDMFHLCGSGTLMDELIYSTQELHMWPSLDFFYAKQQEQKKRYKKYGDTAYNLEPNVKFGVGGLRDLQTSLSIGKRHFNIKHLAGGISYGLITDKEYEELIYCQHFLWRVRFALHMLADKAEERLSFEYQIKLSTVFGYTDKPYSLGIEQFMKDYFKIIKRNKELNEILLQWFDETIAHHETQKISPLDNEFQLSNKYIEVRHVHVFTQNPKSLLKLFLWIATHPEIEGVRANTIRLLRQSLYLMGNRFKTSSDTAQIFLSIFKEGNNPYKALQSMNQYGVLGHYIECFAAVTGQMQYDLFHIYTVDQHTLYVIRNISRFKQEKYRLQFPLCHKIMPDIKLPEILYLAALFHDIAKGRGGDHSELGALEAQQFAQRHALDEPSTDLLIWLVRNHLLMSQTAQRQDIYDPITINQFCQLLPQPNYLEYLYLLTVADICATNARLWNAWKDSLLKELYTAARYSLHKSQGLMDEISLINIRKKYAMDILGSEGFLQKELYQLWDSFKGKYFLHESPEVIARHTRAILTCKEFPLVMIMPHHSQGGTEVFIYMPHCDERFTIATTVLSNHHVTIQEASISSCNNHFDLDIYIILDENNQAFLDTKRSTAIQQALKTRLANKTSLPNLSRKRVSTVFAHFKIPTQINYGEDTLNKHTRLFLVSNDRPGLLATISRIFLKEIIYLHNAKIGTAGERAEDMFYITNQAGLPLTQLEQDALRQHLIKELT